jgi:hypothetical protein
MMVCIEYDAETGEYVPAPEPYLDGMGQLQFLPPMVSGDGGCMICGHRPATGQWSGTPCIQVCHLCAIEQLPALIADAVVGWTHRRDRRWAATTGGPEPGMSSAEVMRHVEHRFWRAYALATDRATRAPKGDVMDAEEFVEPDPEDSAC